jgi:hypothetical protein
MKRMQTRVFLLICDPVAQTSNAGELNELLAVGWRIKCVCYEPPHGMLMTISGEVDSHQNSFVKRSERVDGGLPS